jgi:predicted peptidase
MHRMTWVTTMLVLPLFADQPQPTSQPAESHADHDKPKPVAGFLYRTIEISDETFPYCVYVPPEYRSDKPWPVILFLHGAGERGNDGLVQTGIGIGDAIRRARHDCPAIVVMPQCPSMRHWEPPLLDMAMRCLERTLNEYRCDHDRIYLTGLSMGGAGAWRLAARSPETFAAVVPICGFWDHPDIAAQRPELEEAAAKLASLPIWCFHGATDQAVPAQRSQEIVEAVRTAGGEIKYTEYVGVGHNSWARTYADRGVWRWLFAQKRQTRTRPAP